jgi:hypothetical protein
MFILCLVHITWAFKVEKEKGHDRMCYRTDLRQEYSNLQLLRQIHRKRVELPGVVYVIMFVLNFCFA